MAIVFLKFCPFKSKYKEGSGSTDPDEAVDHPNLEAFREMLQNTRFVASLLAGSESKDEIVKRNVFPFHD